MQETVKKQASIMSKTVQKREEYSEINKITRKPTVREFNKNKNSNNHNKFNKDSSYVSKQKCYNCGKDYPHIKPNECPARGEKCHICGKLNHFGRYCKSKQTPQGRRAYCVKTVQTNQFQDDFIDEDNKSVWRLSTKNEKRAPTVLISFGGSDIEFIIETGAECDIIDENTWSKLFNKPKINKSKTILYIMRKFNFI